MENQNNEKETEKRNLSGLWSVLAAIAFVVIAAIIGSNLKNPGKSRVMVRDPNNPNGVILMKPNQYERKAEKARKEYNEFKKTVRELEEKSIRDKGEQEFQRIFNGSSVRDTTWVSGNREYQIVTGGNLLDLDLDSL